MLFTFIGVGMAVLVGHLLQKRTAKAAPQTPKATTARPQKVHVRLQHVLADTGALVRGRRLFDHASGGGGTGRWALP